MSSQDQVDICHALGNGGFQEVTSNINSVVSGAGHAAHPRDIIPPFLYDLGNGMGTQSYGGKNWDDGQAIFNNGCVRPTPPQGNIRVFVTCIEIHGGLYDIHFGYQSGSPTPVTIPDGPNNLIRPLSFDGPQVTTFQPTPGDTLVTNAFTLRDVPVSTDFSWTLTFNGVTSQATAHPETLGPPCISSAIPLPAVVIRPIGVFVSCVVNRGSTYDAVFGYDSENSVTVTNPIGSANFFSPGAPNRGQPEQFAPGLHDQAVTVTGIPASDRLMWTLAWLDTRSATATAGYEVKCQELPGGGLVPPPPSPGPSPTPPLPVGVFVACVINHGSRYDATFGYSSDNVGVLSVRIGPRNAVSPGRAGRGQPEEFAPGLVSKAFTVRGISASRQLTWRVWFGDELRVARATAAFSLKCKDDPIHPLAHGTVRKTAVPGSVVVGQRVRFTILVHNSGSMVLQPAQVTDTLPAALLRVLSVTSTLGRCRVTTVGGSWRVSCRARELAPGQSFTIHVTARATAPGTARDHAAMAGVPNATASAEVRIGPRAPPPVTG